MNPTQFLDIKDGMCRWPLGEPAKMILSFVVEKQMKKFTANIIIRWHFNRLHQLEVEKKVSKKFRIA